MSVLDAVRRFLGSKTPRQEPFLHRFELKRELLGGSMATVYLARDREDRTLALIKKLQPRTRQSLENLQRELEIHFSLKHPLIAQCRGFEKKGKVYYILMEYVPGTSFRDYLRTKIVSRKQPPPFLSYLRYLRVFSQIARALHFIHAREVLHLDLKPENIMFVKPVVAAPQKAGGKEPDTTFLLMRRRQQDTHAIPPAELNVKIIDFGVSVRGKELQEAVGGSPFYVAPEVLGGKKLKAVTVGQRTDIYSLGATMYELACGRPPFLPDFFEKREGNWQRHWPDYLKQPVSLRRMKEAEMLRGRLKAQPDLSRIPYHHDMKLLLQRCLEPNFKDRYARSQDLVDELDELAEKAERGRQ